MALKTYIGARYAPQFMGEYNSTIEYKPLSVVYSGGISYTSRTYVPANTPLTNASFWIKSADYNAQVAQYRQEVQQYASQIDSYKQEVDKYVATVTRLDNQMQTFTTTITADFNKFKQDVNTANQQMQENFNQQVNEVKAFADETLHSFDTKALMVADNSLKTGQTLLTCGGDSIGDGKASFYQVQDTSATDTVALANGKFAKPFKLQAYEDPGFAQIKKVEFTDVVASSNHHCYIDYSKDTGLSGVANGLSSKITFSSDGNVSLGTTALPGYWNNSYALNFITGSKLNKSYKNYTFVISINRLGVSVKFPQYIGIIDTYLKITPFTLTDDTQTAYIIADICNTGYTNYFIKTMSVILFDSGAGTYTIKGSWPSTTPLSYLY